MELAPGSNPIKKIQRRFTLRWFLSKMCLAANQSAQNILYRIGCRTTCGTSEQHFVILKVLLPSLAIKRFSVKRFR